MANFNTHLSVATFASSSIALVAVGIHLITLNDLIEFIFLGAIGGLLPDIDASNSKPARLLFNTLGLLIVLTALWFYKSIYSIQYLVLIAIGSFIFVRYIVFAVFNRLTVHRGIFHSLLAALFFGLTAVCLSYYVLHCISIKAWLSGIFIAFGYVVHLLLDECYSVDLTNKRLKKSFGTALKLWSYKSNSASLMMGLCTLVMYSITPSIQPLIKAVPWQDILMRVAKLMASVQ